MSDGQPKASRTQALLVAGQLDPHRGAARRSRVFPHSPERLLHADLHNHTRLSDGEGWAEDAFASMRSAGLDVAAVTDHTYGICEPSKTIDDAGWRQLGKLADAADEPGTFVAIRGFEWSSPSLGHMNVWDSSSWTEPLPLVADEVPQHQAIKNPGPAENPAAIAEFYEWLRSDPTRPGRGGGADGLIGFNHPGREPDRFGLFRYDDQLVDRVVAFEMFNREEDYLFERVNDGPDGVSPLVECLDAGWRVGLVGVTDEHGPSWGFPVGLGRTGLWVTGRARSFVREAMLRRRMFATRERGLRADAAANGVPMGGRLAHTRGDITFEVDIDRGPDRGGAPLLLQILQTGRPLPTVVHEEEFDAVEGQLITCTTEIARDAGDWVVLRVTDPALPADPRAAPFRAYRSAGRTLAYLSPFFLTDQAA